MDKLLCISLTLQGNCLLKKVVKSFGQMSDENELKFEMI